MRLTRRIAIATLSAVMLFSMLTACGGGEQPPANDGGGTGAEISSGSNNGTVPGNDNNADTGTGAAGDNGTANPSTWTSRAAKYFTRKGVTGKTRYIRYGYINKLYDSVEEVTEACDGTRHYQNVPATDDEFRDIRLNQLYDETKQVLYEYYIGGNGEKMLEVRDDKTLQGWAKNVSYIPYDLSLFRTEPAEPRTIEGVEYYCEKDKNSYCRYYCFDKDDTEGLDLKYIVNIDGSGWETIVKIKEVRPDFDPALMQIPEGYTNVKTGEVTGEDSYPNN